MPANLCAVTSFMMVAHVREKFLVVGTWLALAGMIVGGSCGLSSPSIDSRGPRFRLVVMMLFKPDSSCVPRVPLLRLPELRSSVSPSSVVAAGVLGCSCLIF